MIKKQFIVNKETGFARPSTLLVSLAHQFASDIFLECRGKTINLKHSPKSIMDIMDLGIKPGTKIYIKAIGTDEAQAIEMIRDNLIKNDYVQ